jgi:hypothetical protein
MRLAAYLAISLLLALSLLILYPNESFASVDDRSHSFDQIKNLSETDGNSQEPRLISLGNNVYVVWSDFSSDFSYGESEILLSASKDGRIAFNAWNNLSNTTGSSFNPQIAAVGENVYVAWDDQTYGNDEVLFAVSKDNGTIFNMINLSNSAENSADPRIAAAGHYVYVAWTEQNPATGHDDIMLRISADEGANFGSTVNLSNNDYGNARNPQIAAIGNYLYVTWSGQHSLQDGSSEIFLKSSQDNGNGFSDIVNLSRTDGRESVDQRLAVSGSDLFVVWHDYSPTISDVLFKRVRNGGTSFDNAINLSDDTAENATGSGSPQIAVSGNNVYVIWYDFSNPSNSPIYSGSNTILFRASHDGGGSFNDKVVIENEAGAAFPQQLAASGSEVYVVWQSNIDDNNEVFFSESHDGGQSFRHAINLSGSADESYFPQVATTDGSEVYVSWIDNNDIMFATSAAGSQQPSQPEPTKQVTITEVELLSVNGTQWIEVFNPTEQEISLSTMYINSTDGKAMQILGGLGSLPPQQYQLVTLESSDGSWSNANNAISIYSSDPNLGSVELWDITPPLTDTFFDDRTWQLDGTEWTFVEATPRRVIPEFPIVQLIIAISIVGILTIFSVQNKVWKEY